jgi:hypothetical protein
MPREFLRTTRAYSCRQKDAAGQQIEPRPAIHLALEQLQPVDVAFDGALTPGQGHPGFHGGIIRPPSLGKAPEGREGARGGTHQPWLQLGRLALADEGGEVPGERHGLPSSGVCVVSCASWW